MSIFDLLFLLALLTTAVCLLAAGTLLLVGRRHAARHLLVSWCIGAGAYLGASLVTSWLAPQRVIRVGEPWCFDDWCLSVEGVSQTPAPPDVVWHVSLGIFSRARRVSQRALGAWVYVIDKLGNRYAPEPDASAIPLDVLLGPGERVSTSRTFRVPAGAGELGLITGHGGCCIGSFIIDDQSGLAILRFGNRSLAIGQEETEEL